MEKSLENMTLQQILENMTLQQIASLIGGSWRPVNYGAKPYLDAMYQLDDIKQNYGADSGISVVLYFLSNAQTWRGPVARQVKKELKRRIAKEAKK